MHSLVVRPIEEQDIPDAIFLVEKSILAHPAGFRAVPVESHSDFIRRLMSSRAAGGGDFLVGLLDGTVVATGGLDPLGMKALNTDGRCPEIARLHVALPHQGKGLGRKVLLSLIDRAAGQGFDSVQLHVTRTQGSAVALYRKTGFTLFDERVLTVRVREVAADGTPVTTRRFPTLFFRRPVVV